MFKSLPTACLTWLDQAIDTQESGWPFPELEAGLWYWAEQLLPLLKRLYDESHASHQGTQAMAEYCEVCLELCDSLLQVEEPDFEHIQDWRQQLELAASAFLQAEQELTESGRESSLVA